MKVTPIRRERTFPERIRRINAKTVSVSGTAKINSGTRTEIAACILKVPRIDITERVYPRKSEPVSPIKILAGCLLNGRKPKHAPISITAITAYDNSP